MTLWRDKERSSRDVKQLALRHISDIDVRIQQLEEMRDTLERLTLSCSGDDTPDCAIIEDFATWKSKNG